MSFAFLALYTGDYLRDTRHLTPLKHGVYLLLLMHCWDQRGPLPLDEQECAGIANCRSADEVDALRYILKRFFTKMDDGWYNRRMQLEVERAGTISSARSQAGKLGYQAKAKQLLSKSQASDSTPTTTPTITPTTTTKIKNTVSQKRKRPQQFSVPENFCISERVQKWADQRGEKQLKAHFLHFTRWALAKGAVYADWDQALMNAVRGDWAGLRKAGIT